MYHIDRTIRETGGVSDNGLQEIYVNTKIDDGSDVAELMRIFKEQSAYNFGKFPKTSERKRHFLVGEGGREEMCEAVESYAKQVAQEQAEEIARKLFVKGANFDMVRECVECLMEEDLKKIYEEVTGTAS